jgi:hypothetical protein
MAFPYREKPTIEQAILSLNAYTNVYTSTTEPIDYIQNRTYDQVVIAFKEYSLQARTTLLQIYSSLQPLVCTNYNYDFCLQQAFYRAERIIHEKFGTTPIVQQYGDFPDSRFGFIQSGTHFHSGGFTYSAEL